MASQPNTGGPSGLPLSLIAQAIPRLSRHDYQRRPRGGWHHRRLLGPRRKGRTARTHQAHSLLLAAQRVSRTALGLSAVRRTRRADKAAIAKAQARRPATAASLIANADLGPASAGLFLLPAHFRFSQVGGAYAANRALPRWACNLHHRPISGVRHLPPGIPGTAQTMPLRVCRSRGWMWYRLA